MRIIEKKAWCRLLKLVLFHFVLVLLMSSCAAPSRLYISKDTVVDTGLRGFRPNAIIIQDDGIVVSGESEYKPAVVKIGAGGQVLWKYRFDKSQLPDFPPNRQENNLLDRFTSSVQLDDGSTLHCGNILKSYRSFNPALFVWIDRFGSPIASRLFAPNDMAIGNIHFDSCRAMPEGKILAIGAIYQVVHVRTADAPAEVRSFLITAIVDQTKPDLSNVKLFPMSFNPVPKLAFLSGGLGGDARFLAVGGGYQSHFIRFNSEGAMTDHILPGAYIAAKYDPTFKNFVATESVPPHFLVRLTEDEGSGGASDRLERFNINFRIADAFLRQDNSLLITGGKVSSPGFNQQAAVALTGRAGECASVILPHYRGLFDDGMVDASEKLPEDGRYLMIRRLIPTDPNDDGPVKGLLSLTEISVR